MNHYRIFYKPLGVNRIRVKQALKSELDDLWAFRQQLLEQKTAHKCYEWDSISETWTDTGVGFAEAIIKRSINAGFKIIIDK